MSFIKWFALAFPFLTSSSSVQEPVSVSIKFPNEPVIESTCKPFPECEVESLEAQGNQTQ